MDYARAIILAVSTELAACSHGSPAAGGGVAGSAGSAPDSSCPQLEAVRESAEHWRALAAMSGESYWYEEEDCVVNSLDGSTTRVSVQGDSARIIDKAIIARSACEATVNRYEDFTAETFEELYTQCEALVSRHCETAFRVDADGVIKQCSWNDDVRCADACGSGFYLRRWGFGRAP
jgi:hypothetical protein